MYRVTARRADGLSHGRRLASRSIAITTAALVKSSGVVGPEVIPVHTGSFSIGRCTGRAMSSRSRAW
jgi:hypothetical protein